jgi:hypothetical protein
MIATYHGPAHRLDLGDDGMLEKGVPTEVTDEVAEFLSTLSPDKVTVEGLHTPPAEPEGDDEDEEV